MKGFTLAVFAASLAAASFASTAVPADAKPSVALKMSGFVVQRSGSAEKLVPIEQTHPHPGDVLRYVVVANNSGSDAASKLVVAARVPEGTSFAGGSATKSAVLHPQYSLDGGKTWAAAPTTTVHTATGDVVQKADPSSFTSVRWIEEKPLAAHASKAYAYEVVVK